MPKDEWKSNKKQKLLPLSFDEDLRQELEHEQRVQEFLSREECGVQPKDASTDNDLKPKKDKAIAARKQKSFASTREVKMFFKTYREDFPKHEVLGQKYVFHVSRWRGRQTS